MGRSIHCWKGGGEIPDEMKDIRGLVTSLGKELRLPGLVRSLSLVFDVYQTIDHGLVGSWKAVKSGE